jgi:hypothetical protein
MKPDTTGKPENKDVRRRRRYRGPGVKKQPDPSPGTVKADTTPPEIPPVLKSLLEEVAERLRVELTTNGRVPAKALFVYDEGAGTKTVSVALSVRSEQQKDATRKRIREKAVQEGARAVVIVHNDRAGILTLSGATADARIGLSIRYVFDAKTKTVTRWDMQWQKEAPPY